MTEVARGRCRLPFAAHELQHDDRCFGELGNGMRYLAVIIATGLLASCGWQSAEAGQISFETVRLQCKSYDGDLSHRFADVDYVTIGSTGMEMSIEPIATSDTAWVFENTDKYESIGGIDHFYAQDVSGKRSGNGVIGAGIRAGTPFFFDLSEINYEKDLHQFMISTSENASVYNIFFRCFKI